MSPRALPSVLAVALVLCFTVASVGAPVSSLGGSPSGPIGTASAASAATPSGILDLTYSGPAVAVRQNDTTYVWMDGRTEVGAYVKPLGDPGRHELCVRLVRDGKTVTDHGCRELDVDRYGQFAPYELSQLGANETGRHDIVVELRDAEDEGRNQTRTIPVVAVERTGDIDNDNLTNAREVELGTNIHEADTDADGLEDGAEVKQYDSDPTLPDTDSDGLEDGSEANQFNTSLTSPDTDADGARDGVEVTKGTDPLSVDTDGDGLTDGEEMNRYSTNPTLPDTDGDGLEDGRELELGTDPMAVDTDGDGLLDGEEVERYDTDPTLPDTDGDGLEDGTEVDRGTDPTAPQTTSPENASGGGGGLPNAPLTLGFVLLAGIAIGVYARYGRGRDHHGDADGEPSIGGGAPPGASTASDDGPEPLDPDLLSPEEYVTRLLDRHGGRMQQRDIVEETDWSKATVSRRLSKMEEEGVVERTRIGRGKVVERADPDVAPDAVEGR
jgi:hypothetical protein